MVVGSNRELLVRDVTSEKCYLADFGLIEYGDWKVPQIDTLIVKVQAG